MSICKYQDDTMTLFISSFVPLQSQLFTLSLPSILYHLINVTLSNATCQCNGNTNTCLNCKLNDVNPFDL